MTIYKTGVGRQTDHVSGLGTMVDRKKGMSAGVIAGVAVGGLVLLTISSKLAGRSRRKGLTLVEEIRGSK